MNAAALIRDDNVTARSVFDEATAGGYDGTADARVVARIPESDPGEVGLRR
jgi:hypothetical protein